MAIVISDGNEEKDEVIDEVETVTGTVEDAEAESTEKEQEKPADKTEEKKFESENKKKKDKDKKKKFKDKEKDRRDEQIEELNNQIGDLNEQIKRNLAEFDNYRKRTDKEKDARFDMGAKSVIEKLLPIIDNFERGLSTITEEQKADDSFVNGMDMIYKQLLKQLEELGVAPIETAGKEFDPNLHNAVMHVDDENLGENVIAQEFQKGYTFKDTVIRHSMVQVAN